jgi:ribonuclease P protein component
MENGTAGNRLGISVSKKVGNSVVRHRLTRLAREAYRLNEHYFKRGYDLVIVVRKMAPGIGYAQMEKSMMKLSKMHGVLLYGKDTDQSH